MRRDENLRRVVRESQVCSVYKGTTKHNDTVIMKYVYLLKIGLFVNMLYLYTLVFMVAEGKPQGRTTRVFPFFLLCCPDNMHKPY